MSEPHPKQPSSSSQQSPPRTVLEYLPPSQRVARDAPIWTTVYNCRNLLEANLAVATLQRHGLEARVDGENAAAQGAWAGVPVGTRVQVYREHVDRAKVLLDGIDQARERRLRLMRVHCPKCDAEAKRQLHPLRKVAVALLVGVPVVIAINVIDEGALPVWLVVPLTLLGGVLLFWSVTPRWRCASCDLQWSQPEPEEMSDDDDEEEDDPVEADVSDENDAEALKPPYRST